MMRAHTTLCPRTGFTRIDLAVTAGLMILIAGLTLPALQASRADAARSQCQNNLRKLGQAFQKFETTHGGFPARRIGFGSGTKAGWGALILAELGEEELARKYSFKLDFYDPGNKAVVETSVKTFVCPASPTGRVTPIKSQASGQSENPDKDSLFHVDGAVNDYITSNGFQMPRGGYGVNWFIDRAGNRHQATDDDTYLPLSKISDGLSCTLLLIEQAGRPQSWRNGKKIDKGNLFGMAANARGTWAGWGSIAFGPAARADGNRPANGDASDCSVNCNNQFGIYGFHAGGANVLFCDGSVRFLGDKLNGLTFGLLTTRDDGQMIGADDY